MKKTLILLLSAILILTGVSCAKTENDTPVEKDEKTLLLERFSYTIGYSNASFFEEKPSMTPDYGYMIRGTYDFQDMDKEPLITLDEMVSSYESFIGKAETSTTPAEKGKELSEKKILKLSAPSTEHEKYSYSFGYILASNAIYQFGDIDFDYLRKGLTDRLFEHDAMMSAEEMEASISEYSAFVQRQYEETIGKEKKENLEEAQNFLAENSKKDGIIAVNAYCQIEFTKKGPEETQVKLGDSVKLNYKLTNLQGDVIDQGNGVVFPMDTNQMIKGFVEGCTAMHVGDSARVYIHPEHGYGEYGPSGIGPNRLLIFDIDELGIEN